MANYGIQISDNGDGSWTLTSCLRAVTTVSGGTSLLTNTFTQTAATGALASASGFLVSATTTTDGLGHILRSPSEVIERAKAIIQNDRVQNG